MKLRSIILFMASVFWLQSFALVIDPNKPDYLYVPDDQLDAEGKGTVDVWLNTYVEEYNSFIMDIYLPEGFTIDKDRRGNYVFKFNTEEDVIYDHTMASADREGFIRILGCSLTSTFILSGDHRIFSFGITAPEGFNEEATVVIKKIQFAEGVDVETGGDHDLPDVSFLVKPYDTSTGIDAVEVGDGNVTVFNLQGMEVLHNAPAERLSSLPSGIYIVNGVKVALRK